MRLELGHVVGPLAQEGLVAQPLGHHHMQHGVEQGHIGVGLEGQRAPGVATDVGHARVHQHDACAALGRVLHPGGSHRVVVGRVRSDDDDQLRMLDVAHRVAHGARAHALKQRRDAGRVAQAGAVVHVVAAKAGAHQLLEQVGLFVAALGRAETGQGLEAELLFECAQRLGGGIQRLFPARFAKDLAPVGVAIQQ